MPENITKSMLNRGMVVEVNPRTDKSRNILVKGIVSDVLTSKEFHPHGILVRLIDGTEGRVKSICSSEVMDSIPGNNISDIKVVLSDLIGNGEDHFIEFKTSILWSKYKTKDEIISSKSYELKRFGQNASKYIIAKSLCGFLNSDGGTLIIGVKELKDSDEAIVVGVESEYNKLKDKTQDGYRRMILDEVIKPYLPSHIFNHFNQYLSFQFEEIEGKTVLGIHTKPSDIRVFVHIANEDIFFVRIDASTRQLTGPELVDYCAKRFN